jgi:hypothetical protein
VSAEDSSESLAWALAFVTIKLRSILNKIRESRTSPAPSPPGQGLGVPVEALHRRAHGPARHLPRQYVDDIIDNVKKALAAVDPTPFFTKYGDNAWAAVKTYQRRTGRPRFRTGHGPATYTAGYPPTRSSVRWQYGWARRRRTSRSSACSTLTPNVLLIPGTRTRTRAHRPRTSAPPTSSSTTLPAPS